MVIGGSTAALALRAGSVGGGLAPPAHVVSAGRDLTMVTTHEFDDVFRSSYSPTRPAAHGHHR